MRRRRTLLLVLVALVSAVAAACSSTSPLLASFTRDWGDGRVETLELHEDGRVLMNHVGTVDRATLTPGDVERLRASLEDIAPAADATTTPRLTLTPAGRAPVVVDAGPGTTGELFVSLLDHHRLP
jgi:hypothetical protein